ncbi:MAG: hypothetical protein ABIO06_05215 [Pseudolysinimonas sp.]
MVAIQIRDVPERVREGLATEAERRGQSLQVFLMAVLEREAASADNLRWLREIATRSPVIGNDLDIAALIASGHAERDQRILDAVHLPDSPPSN